MSCQNNQNNGNKNEDGAKAVAELLVRVFMFILVDAVKESRFLEEEFVEACFGGFWWRFRPINTQ